MSGLIDQLETLIAMHRERGRPIAKYAKRKRPDPRRRAMIESLADWVPEDLFLLYERYDGAEPPQTMWQGLGNFFGPFFWHASDILKIINGTSKSRTPFPLGDEIALCQSVSAPDLTLSPIGQCYVLTATRSPNSDVRYPAFDTLGTMIETYIAALNAGVWSFAEDGSSRIDKAEFADLVTQFNRHCDFWALDRDGKADFDRPAYERGERRPRLEPVSGQDLLAASGFDLRA